MATSSKQGLDRRDGGITISGLTTFVSAVDCGGFSRAAVMLGVTQPNISNQINALENALGLRLLNRRSSPPTLTDAGRDIYVRARLVLSRMSDLEANAREFGALRKGKLRIGFSSPRIALGSIARFMAQYPDIEVTTKSGNTESLRRDVLDCSVDVGLFSLREPDPALSCTLIGRHNLELLTLAEADSRIKPSVSLTTAAGLPLVGREPGSMTRALTEEMFNRNGLTFKPTLVVTGAQAVYEAVLAKVGSTIIFSEQAQGDDRFCSRKIDGANLDAGLYFVTLPENLEIPAVAAMLQTTLSVSDFEER